MSSSTLLWYSAPAAHWFDAFPIGNGRLGAVVFGDPRAERIALSESTFWSGKPSTDNVPQDSAETVAEVRRLLSEGKIAKAEELSQSAIGRRLDYGTNLPFGNLRIYTGSGIGEQRGYRRELDLDTGMATVTYVAGGVRFRREAFVSHPDGVLAVRVSADASGAVTCSIDLDGDEQPSSGEASGDGLTLRVLARETVHSDGRCGVTGFARASVTATGGEVEVQLGRLLVHGADEVTVLLAASTDFTGDDPVAVVDAALSAAKDQTFESLKEGHIRDHQSLFRRVSLDLGPGPSDELPLDERLARIRDGQEDNALYALLFQYGRYLLLGGSRNGSPLPAHLLGVWNDNIACRIGWTCDYHLDINTQMNYWIAETTGLSECHDPLFNWIEDRLVPSGERTARELYGCDGWVAHTVSNAWGYSAAGWSTWWGFFPTAGVWVASHLWDHYEFTGDLEFLKGRAYPVLRSAAEFFLGHLQLDPDTGWLVTGPACSPETGYLHEGRRYAITVGPTVDRILLDELFRICLEAIDALGVDADLAEKLREARGNLPPYQVGRHGQIQEWIRDYEEALPHHRHTSHLMGVYPFSQITTEDTPELAAAALTSIERRISAPGGFEEGGWARNNLTLYYARLGRAEKAWQSLKTLMTVVADRSLMAGTKLAPHSAYEMDYNTGASAGVVEMLFQSHRGRLHLLPALPPSWTDGSVRGLRGRGGFVVDIEWSMGDVCEARITSTLGRPCRIVAGVPVTVRREGSADTLGSGTEVDIETRPGDVFIVRPVG